MSTIWPTWVSSRGSQPAFCARPIRFPERGQIFRRRQERAINRRPEKLMNNTRRRESGHSRRRPMVTIYFRAPIQYSTRTESLVDFTLHPPRRKTFSPSYCLHYERLSHSAAHISLPTSPSRRNVRRAGQIALSISDACSALTLPHLVLLFALHRCGLMESSAHPCQHAPLIFHLMYISYLR